MTVPAASLVVPAASLVMSAAFTAVVSMMPAALTAASEHLNEFLDFFFGGISVLDDLSREVQGFASQGVVGVDGDAVVLYLHHFCHELMVFGIVHGDDGTLIDMFVVKLAVDGEDVTLQAWPEPPRVYTPQRLRLAAG